MLQIYETSPDELRKQRGMATLRTFIGIAISPVIQQQILAAQKAWGEVVPGIRWIKPENLHLTLKFLGEIEETLVDPIHHRMQRVAGGVAPFTLTIQGLGVFPNLSRPRVLWLGVNQGKQSLQTLYALLQAELTPLGFPAEKRAYTPHLTLARFKTFSSPSLLSALLQQSLRYEFAPLSVHRIDLIRSQLHPGGAIYTCLRSVELSQPEES
ncbi:MAG: RNA 2',3'-cyclic phosphodiesterase [Nitrospinota bacterium]|nr:MAG: RNA 2',3'-cyclic phosphodiesterase [Nitrospinota bacterium]